MSEILHKNMKYWIVNTNIDDINALNRVVQYNILGTILGFSYLFSTIYSGTCLKCLYSIVLPI